MPTSFANQDPVHIYEKRFSACAGENINLKCEHGAKINRVSSAFGRWDNTKCPHSTVIEDTPKKFSMYTEPTYYANIIGKTSYDGQINFNDDPYPNVYKQVEGSYSCQYDHPKELDGYDYMNVGVYTDGSNISVLSTDLKSCMANCNKEANCLGVSWRADLPPTVPFECALKNTLAGNVVTDDPGGWITYKKHTGANKQDTIAPASAPTTAEAESATSNLYLTAGAIGAVIFVLLVILIMVLSRPHNTVYSGATPNPYIPYYSDRM